MLALVVGTTVPDTAQPARYHRPSERRLNTEAENVRTRRERNKARGQRERELYSLPLQMKQGRLHAIAIMRQGHGCSVAVRKHTASAARNIQRGRASSVTAHTTLSNGGNGPQPRKGASELERGGLSCLFVTAALPSLSSLLSIPLSLCLFLSLSFCSY